LHLSFSNLMVVVDPRAGGRGVSGRGLCTGGLRATDPIWCSFRLACGERSRRFLHTIVRNAAGGSLELSWKPLIASRPNRAFGVKMEFRILGPVEVWDGGRRLDVGGPKPRAVLAALLLHAGRMVSADRLIDELWGETPPATARNVLQCHVARLRRALHRPAEANGSTPVLLTRPGGYLLRVEPGQLDLHRFREAADRGRRAMAAGDAGEAAEQLRRALALWRGPALADVASESLRRTAAPPLEEARLVALEERLDADLALGRHTELVGELEALVAAHPDRERPRRQLMLALYRSGRLAEALAVYRSARRLLVEELGLEPSPALQQLERAMLLADPALETPPPAASGHPPRPAPPPGPCELPPDIEDFTGRESPLAELESLLADNQATAIVITAIAGKAGVGKTALAVRLAHRLRSRFPGGQLYVNLRGAGTQPLDPADVLAGFLRALGVESAAIAEGLDERSRQFRARLADDRVLVVLDNAAGEAQVRPLLPGGRGCAALITSRVGLRGLEAAHPLTLDVLDPDQAVALLAKLAGPARVAAEPDAAWAIARLCGFLPLAVRIAGARLQSRPHWRLKLLAGRLADERRRLDELRTGDLEVRASVALSYQGRGEEERRLFRLLGLLESPSFPAWVPASLLDAEPPEAEELLERLVDAQLVEAAGEDPAGQQRYRLHDLLRVFARERLEDEEPAPARLAALEQVLEASMLLAEHADSLLVPSGIDSFGGEARCHGRLEHPAVVAVEHDPASWFEAERTSLLAAVRQACEADLWELGRRLALALGGFFQLRSYWDDWQQTHMQALAAARRAGDRDGQARLLAALGDLHNTQHRPEDGLRYIQESVQAFRETGNRWGELQSLVLLAEVDLRLGRLPAAVGRLERSLAGFEGLRLPGWQALTLFYLGWIHQQQGRADAALDSLERSLELFRAVNDRCWEAAVLRKLGEIRVAQGSFQAAADHLEQGLALVRAVGDRVGEAYLLLSVGEVQRCLGRPGDAASHIECSLALARATRESDAEAQALLALGDLRREQGCFDEASGYLESSLATFRELQCRDLEARALDSLGRLLAARGDPAAARTAWRTALGIFRELGMPEAASVAARLGDVHPLQPADGQGQGGQGDQGGQDGRADWPQPGLQAEAAAVEDGGEHALGVAADGQRRRRGGDRDHRPLPEQGVGQADQQGPGHQQRQQHPEGAVGEDADHGGQQHAAEQVGRPEPAGGDHVSDRLGR
jgi:DNA-binding SARP family transcriptional activator/predicted negative regulator of RcsB-dependent stress response